ncbi:hypothetical protein ACFWXO_05225 [Kitasatospora sp. NPDC059088]|uniref:hypothetical protein n=1 Tax=Kitasatospora sp. NPDC059088 TaxID=3346722 RepID=UPI003678100A
MNPITRPAAAPEAHGDDVHTYFGLSYAGHLVLNRSLLQSMPPAWQRMFVLLMRQLNDAFDHVPQPEAYIVTAATEHIVRELSDADLAAVGITRDWYGGLAEPQELDPEALVAWQDEHRLDEPVYSDGRSELDPDGLVQLPVADPLPHYNRGRTRVPRHLPEPLLDGAELFDAYQYLAEATSGLATASTDLDGHLVQGLKPGAVADVLELALAVAAAGLPLEGTDYPRAYATTRPAPAARTQAQR